MCLSICTMIMNSTATNADDVSGAPISQAELLSVFTMKNNSQWNHEQNKVQKAILWRLHRSLREKNQHTSVNMSGGEMCYNEK